MKTHFPITELYNTHFKVIFNKPVPLCRPKHPYGVSKYAKKPSCLECRKRIRERGMKKIEDSFYISITYQTMYL